MRFPRALTALALTASIAFAQPAGAERIVVGDVEAGVWSLADSAELAYCLTHTPAIVGFTEAGNGWSAEWEARQSLYCTWAAYGQILGRRIARDHVAYRAGCVDDYACWQLNSRIDEVLAGMKDDRAYTWNTLGFVTGLLAMRAQTGAVFVPR